MLVLLVYFGALIILFAYIWMFTASDPRLWRLGIIIGMFAISRSLGGPRHRGSLTSFILPSSYLV